MSHPSQFLEDSKCPQEMRERLIQRPLSCPLPWLSRDLRSDGPPLPICGSPVRVAPQASSKTMDIRYIIREYM